MRSVQLLLVGTLFLLMACNGQKKASIKKETAAMNESLELVISDNYSGADVSETLIINNEKALNRFYAKINMTRKPGLPVPNVDFTKEIIILTCSGERNDGSIPVVHVEAVTDAQLVLSTSLKSDKSNGTGAITSPFSLYKMPLTDKEIVFEVRP